MKDVITLFLKIRCFSYTKDLLQQIKAKEKAKREKALRKELKKKESTKAERKPSVNKKTCKSTQNPE